MRVHNSNVTKSGSNDHSSSEISKEETGNEDQCRYSGLQCSTFSRSLP